MTETYITTDKENHPMTTTDRLEYLRSQIRAERISYYELAELQDLADHIHPSDVELLEWAGVPEGRNAQARAYYEGNR